MITKILKQIVEAFDHLDGDDTDQGEIPFAKYDEESETVALTYGAGHNVAVYSVTVTRVY